MTFDWKRDGHAEIPLNVRVGHVFKVGKQPMNAFVQPFYTIDHAGAGSPDWGFKVNLTLLFPELKMQF
jgi:hypothetical protein